jgi:hypothetical protein
LSGEAPSIDLKGDPSGSLSNLRLAVPVEVVALKGVLVARYRAAS